MSDEDKKEVRKPWAAYEKVDEDTLKRFKGGFKLQDEVDSWIRKNVKEGQVLVSMRSGNAFMVQTIKVKKTTELAAV